MLAYVPSQEQQSLAASGFDGSSEHRRSRFFKLECATGSSSLAAAPGPIIGFCSPPYDVSAGRPQMTMP